VALIAPSGGGSDNFVINAVPAALASNVFGNVVGTATFTSVGAARSRTKAGFVVTVWPTGTAAGDAAALTTTVGAGSSSTALTVADANAFYDGWNIVGEVGDYIYIGANAGSATLSQISSINYSTNVITLVAARSWSNGDGEWFGGNAANGVAQIHDNRGGNQ
jgi:hypothetical protein